VLFRSTTDPTESDPTETDDPRQPVADLGLRPIEQSRFLGLFWNRLTIPTKGVHKVDSATMVITVENLVRWNDSGEATWQCGQADESTLVCTVDGDATREADELELVVTTSRRSSDVTATIDADGYRDPNPRNNSVSTEVDY